MPHATLVKVKVYIHGQSGHSTENKDTVASEQNQWLFGIEVISNKTCNSS